jgi:serine/threonine protein kinase
LSKDGFTKILDFGMARSMPGSGISRHRNFDRNGPETAPGALFGTVPYVSREQVSGERVDFRSDRFSFGALLYEMATARRIRDERQHPHTVGDSHEPDRSKMAPEDPASAALDRRTLSGEDPKGRSRQRGIAHDLSTCAT